MNYISKTCLLILYLNVCIHFENIYSKKVRKFPMNLELIYLLKESFTCAERARMQITDKGISSLARHFS